MSPRFRKEVLQDLEEIQQVLAADTALDQKTYDALLAIANILYARFNNVDEQLDWIEAGVDKVNQRLTAVGQALVGTQAISANITFGTPQDKE